MPPEGPTISWPAFFAAATGRRLGRLLGHAGDPAGELFETLGYGRDGVGDGGDLVGDAVDGGADVVEGEGLGGGVAGGQGLYGLDLGLDLVEAGQDVDVCG